MCGFNAEYLAEHRSWGLSLKAVSRNIRPHLERAVGDSSFKADPGWSLDRGGKEA